MAELDDPLALDRQLCFALYVASRAMTRAYGPLLEGTGLTYPQYLAMLVLWEAPGEATTVGALGARLHLDTGTLTPLLKRLEHSGYITRRRDPGDERRVMVSLTDAGRALRADVTSVPLTLASCLDIGSADGAVLHALLTRVSQALAT